jgi:hypothetical protein
MNKKYRHKVCQFPFNIPSLTMQDKYNIVKLIAGSDSLKLYILLF